MERILILHPGALGDVILTLPFIYSFYKKRIRVSLYTQSWLTDLKKIFNFVQEWRSIEVGGLHKLFSNQTNHAELHWLKNYSRIIALFKDGIPEEVITNSGNNFICRSFLPPPEFKNHIVDYLKEIFGEQPDFSFIQKNTNHLQNYDRIIIHPGSGNKLKNWNIEHYLNLYDDLKKYGANVFFLLGPAETYLTETLRAKNVPFLQMEGLPEVFKLISGSLAYIGNDSGITHLSATTGTRTFAIFGPTDPSIWKPAGGNVSTILRKHSMPECSPCIFRRKTILCNDNSPCMPDYEEVKREVMKAIFGKNSF